MTEIFSGNERDNEHKNLVIPTANIPPAAWQAIYYHLSKKTEVNRKLHNGAFEIDKNSIIDLIYRLKQSITGYGPQAEKVEFSITFRKDSSEQLSSLERFATSDFSHKSSPTKSLAIDFDFIVCPATELSIDQNPPQKFKVFILLDQDFFSDPDSEQASFFPDGIAGKNIMSVVEYSDYAISRALRATVDEWVSTLPRRDTPAILKSLPKLIRWFRGSLPSFASALAVIPFLRFADPTTLNDLHGNLLEVFFVALAVFGAIKIFVGWSLNTVAKIQPTTYLMITSGDKIRKSLIEGRVIRRSAIFVIVFTAIILGFLVGTLSSLFASYISGS